MVVSQSAGASSDIMARLLANPLSERLGQGVVVENKTGGGNVIGANAVARSSPDFEPVALVTRSHQVVVVHPGVGRQDARAADCPGKGFAWKVTCSPRRPLG
jgi:tripartite-type tricarboxylate transporter receptor subunit TctC